VAIASHENLFGEAPPLVGWGAGTGSSAYFTAQAILAEGALAVEKLLAELRGVGGADATTEGVETVDLLGIELADIGLSISAPISHLHYDQAAGTVDVLATIDQAAEISVTLAGEVVGGGAEFSPREVLLRISPTSPLARAEFVASTLTAALALGGAATVRLVDGDVRFRGFDLPLAQISDLLRTRETSLRLMAIGAAIHAEFEFPPHLSGAEIQAIDFVRHAIIDRTFTWPTPRHPLTLPANEPNLRRLQSTTKPARIEIPRTTTVELLGHEIPLGTTRVIMEGAVIEDLDHVVTDVLRLDGHPVQAYVRSLEGRATIECPEAPILPEHPWTEDEAALISLEEQLCSRLTERYNILAAGTLAGLSEAEKADLTNPAPSLGELFVRDEPANEV
jgi:hypothetical protein